MLHMHPAHWEAGGPGCFGQGLQHLLLLSLLLFVAVATVDAGGAAGDKLTTKVVLQLQGLRAMRTYATPPSLSIRLRDGQAHDGTRNRMFIVSLSFPIPTPPASRPGRAM